MHHNALADQNIELMQLERASRRRRQPNKGGQLKTTTDVSSHAIETAESTVGDRSCSIHPCFGRLILRGSISSDSATASHTLPWAHSPKPSSWVVGNFACAPQRETLRQGSRQPGKGPRFSLRRARRGQSVQWVHLITPRSGNTTSRIGPRPPARGSKRPRGLPQKPPGVCHPEGFWVEGRIVPFFVPVYMAICRTLRYPPALVQTKVRWLSRAVARTAPANLPGYICRCLSKGEANPGCAKRRCVDAITFVLRHYRATDEGGTVVST